MRIPRIFDSCKSEILTLLRDKMHKLYRDGNEENFAAPRRFRPISFNSNLENCDDRTVY